MLLDMPKNEGGRPAENRLRLETGLETYAEQGITKTRAFRWQTVAALPEDAFERYLWINNR